MDIANSLTIFPLQEVEDGIYANLSPRIIFPHNLSFNDPCMISGQIHGVFLYRNDGLDKRVQTAIELYRGEKPEDMKAHIALAALTSVRCNTRILPYVLISDSQDEPSDFGEVIKKNTLFLGKQKISQYVMITPERFVVFGDKPSYPVFSRESDPEVSSEMIRLDKEFAVLRENYHLFQ